MKQYPKFTSADTPDNLSEEKLRLCAGTKPEWLIEHLKRISIFDAERVRVLMEMGIAESGRKLSEHHQRETAPAESADTGEGPRNGECEDCEGTGWYGCDGPGIPGNTEFVRCDCGTATKCTAGWHKYRLIDSVAWCDECGLEAGLSVCKLTHVLPNA